VPRVAKAVVVDDTGVNLSDMFKKALENPVSKGGAALAPAAAESPAAAAPAPPPAPAPESISASTAPGPAAEAVPSPLSIPAPAAADAVAPSAAPSAVDSGAAAVDVPAGADKLTGDLQDSAAQLASGVQDKAAEVAGAASKAAAGVTDALTGATSSLTDAVSGVTGGITSTFSGLTSNVTGSAGEVAGKLTSSVTGLTSGVTGTAGEVAGKLTSTVSGAFSSVTGQLNQATSGVQSSVGSAVDTFSSATSAATQKVQDVLGTATASVQQALDSTNQQFTTVTTQVTTAVDSTTQQVLDSLPAPVTEGVVVIGKGLGFVGSQVVQHPVAAGVVTLAVAVPAGLNWYKGRYGGYAGEVSPQLALDLLQGDDEQIFLVDIRPEEEREENGVALLKRAARFRVAAFPLLSDVVPPKLAKEVTNVAELTLLTNAAYIAGLAPVGGQLTKIIVMDGSGGDKARDVARALVAVGMPLSYVLEGGFQAWSAAELPVAEASDYEASAAAALADNVEVIAEKAGEVVTTVSQPNVAVPLIAGTATTAIAVYNWHYTLEYIGVLGVLLTIANKLSQYDNPIEAAKDAGRSIKGTVDAVRSLRLPLAPKLPTLPTLPSIGGGVKGQQAGTAAVAGSSSSSRAAVPKSSSSSRGEAREEMEGAAAESSSPGVEAAGGSSGSSSTTV